MEKLTQKEIVENVKRYIDYIRNLSTLASGQIQHINSMCSLHNNFHGAIFFESNEWILPIFYRLSFINCIVCKEKYKSITKEMNYIEISFKNGSTLNLFNVHNYPFFKGKRYNYIIYDTSINKEYLESVIKPLLVSCRLKNGKLFNKITRVKFPKLNSNE